MIDHLAHIRQVSINLNQLATKRGVNLDLHEEINIDDDKDLKEFIAKIQLVQKYNNQIIAKVDRMNVINDEISRAVGSKEKELSEEIENIIDIAMEDQKKSKVLLDDLNNKVTLKKSEDPVNI